MVSVEIDQNRYEHEPLGNIRKITLLLQRSLRYSYRQRCCGCLPNICLEFLCSFVTIVVLLLARYGTMELKNVTEQDNKTQKIFFEQPKCSQEIVPSSISTNDRLKKCLEFPAAYRTFSSAAIGNISGIVLKFRPKTSDTNQLETLAERFLSKLNCRDVTVESDDFNATKDDELLSSKFHQVILIDFPATLNLKIDRQISYTITVRRHGSTIINDPIDFTFRFFDHPSNFPDRWRSVGNRFAKPPDFPDFSDVKLIIDTILVEYQTGRSVTLEIERQPMICTKYLNNLLLISKSGLISVILILIMIVFLIPYVVLLNSLIQEKKAKVKEILKVLGIQPILNNLAHGLRTFIIQLVVVLVLCAMYKKEVSGGAYFITISFLSLFIGYVCFILQLIAFAIMNAQIFERPVVAIVATGIIYLISFNLRSTIVQWPTGLQYLMIFLSPFIAHNAFFQQIVLHELAYKKISYFQNIYRSVPMFSVTLVMMLLSCLFYWALSWYLEKVFPGDYGIPMEWNFLFKKEYWHSSRNRYSRRPSSTQSSMTDLSDNSTEKRYLTDATILRVNNLVKKFGPDKIAVNNVSFNLYANQITSLLGPNGSGKTTIFNCLIGIYEPTSGSITLASEDGIEHDVEKEIQLLRNYIGYCPQHDILFNLLTIEEQLEFYAVARGFGRYKRQISHELLIRVNLQQSKDTYCQALSGGMKRRLSLACAFVGDTKIILLDEPSSGLDPSNRRLLWDWLRTMKEGKTLLLTTHFMEESDALSDRIIIIANGTIKADGNSSKLKERFGSGYKLLINKQKNVPSHEIENELRGFLPNLSIETDLSGSDVVFQTNQQPNKQFVQALRQLETMKTNNRIKNYGVQNSTMEDVFLTITKNANIYNGKESNVIDRTKIDERCQDIFNDRELNHGFRHYLTQLYGLLIKTCIVRYRRWMLIIIMLILPILYNVLTTILAQNRMGSGIYKMQVTHLNPQKILYNADTSMQTYFASAIGPNSKDLIREQRSDSIRDMNQYIRQQRIDRPYTYTEIYFAFELSAPQSDQYIIKTATSSLISGYEAIAVASNVMFKHAVNDPSASIQTTLIFRQSKSTFSPDIGQVMGILSIASCFIKILPVSLLLDLFIYYLIFFYASIFLISEHKDSFLSLLTISGLHPLFYWLFNYLFDLFLSILWFLYLLLIYCLVEISFNGLPQTSSTPQNPFSSLQFADPWDLRIKFYPLTILIALPTLPFVYLFSRLFKTDIIGGLVAFLLLVIVHIISIIVPIITMFVVNKFILNVFYWLLTVLFPTVNAQVIITYFLAKMSQICQIFRSNDPNQPPPSFMQENGDDTMAWNWIILFAHILIFLLLLIVMDCGLLRFPSCFSSNKALFNENTLDDDVLAERHRIMNLHQQMINQNGISPSEENDDDQETDHLIVHDLVKQFGGRPTPAVNHLTFGARRGEAFGLLGYNGAGKTTTFRIIVGDETASSGTAFIDGKNVSRRFRSVRHLGYCPQQDCSMDYLTVREGLYLLARIRGVTFSRIHSVVETVSSLFLLDPFEKNYIHQLSGGTKRRLHAALALIGPPLVVILDEPTTGVDPNARQQMQEIFLNAVKSKLTIILTSHSMDECERVCNRLGIMVDGQLACLGAIQHLKSKFGRGYTIEIKVLLDETESKTLPMERVIEYLQSLSKYQVKVKETTLSTGVFQIEQGSPADLFELLEQNKLNLKIETYTISQTTLEQIFLSFGKKEAVLP